MSGVGDKLRACAWGILIQTNESAVTTLWVWKTYMQILAILMSRSKRQANLLNALYVAYAMQRYVAARR